MRPPVSVPDLAALSAEAAAFVETLQPKGSAATLVTLSGELGAGKTSFVQAAARALGVVESVTSPTFVLAKSYALPEGLAFTALLHVDAYRLAGGEDLRRIGVSEALQDPGTLLFLEWPDIVKDGLPAADVSITLAGNDDGSRTITYA